VIVDHVFAELIDRVQFAFLASELAELHFGS